MQTTRINLNVAGQTIQAKEGETIIHALWAAGMADAVSTGCAGGVCGACTVTVRYADGKPGGTELACLCPVEEGMEVFPYPVDSIASGNPESSPDVVKLQTAFPTLNRCTKCGSCTAACPMQIPVMDSVLRMQVGKFDEVSEDFTTCIHCGLCRAVCEDRVKPHNMGMWVRRSLGMGASIEMIEKTEEEIKRSKSEWAYLLSEDAEERLKRAKEFRVKGFV